jgi:hypothetical protein
VRKWRPTPAVPALQFQPLFGRQLLVGPDNRKRRQLLGALVDLIVATPNIKPLGVSVCMQAFREISDAEQHRLPTPYFIALEKLHSNLSFCLHRWS